MSPAVSGRGKLKLKLTVATPFALGALTACGSPGDETPKGVPKSQTANAAVRSGYAPVNGLRMYYEVHGAGSPVLLIHGAISTIQTSFGQILPALAKQRRAIAIEQQGHGHTADTDRPLNFDQMADDAAALLRHLKVGRADIVGSSDGGHVAFDLATRHPDLVRKLVILDGNYSNEGLVPEIRAAIESGAGKPEAEVVKGIPPQFQRAYAEAAPQPDQWPSLVSKVMKQGAAFKGRTREQIRAISAPTLLVFADRGQSTPQHMVEMFQIHENAQLAIVPGSDHITLVEKKGQILTPILLDFLAAPMPAVE